MAVEVDDVGQAEQFVAAVHALVRRDRVLSEQELLVTTACELLVSGAATTTDVVEFVNNVWHGAAISEQRIEQALITGAAAGLITATTVRDASGWSLTDSGCADATGSKGWSIQVFARTRRDLQQLARESLRELTEAEADLFVRLLAEALTGAIHEAHASYVGDVELLADGTIKPTSFDRGRALAAIENSDIGEVAAEFLRAAVAAALDSTEPFGNDLIGHIATGCLLHAYLAQTHSGARRSLGPLSGEEFIIETPLLVALLGPTSEAAPIEVTIKTALAAETHVVVPEHCLEELLELVDVVEAQHLEPIKAAIEHGMRARTYAAAVNQGVLQAWVAALDEGRYEHWGDFKTEAGRLKERLKSLGVTVRLHHNEARETVDRCQRALAAEISAASSRRTAAAIGRDAETMAMALRHRRSAPPNRLWPGSWVVTPDRRLGPAYRKVSPSDHVPLTITAAQWSTLVARCGDAPTIESLAKGTAPLLVRDAALAIATRYPPEVALEFARTLSTAEDSTTIDVHVGMALDDAIDPKTGGTVGDGTRLAGDVLARRTRRMTASDQLRASRDQAEVERARKAARLADQRADREKEARDLTDQRALRDQRARQEFEERAISAEAMLSNQRQRDEVLGRRRTTTAVCVTLSLVIGGLALLAGWTVLGAITLLALLVGLKQSQDWRRDPPARLRAVWPAAALELIGVLQVAWSSRH